MCSPLRDPAASEINRAWVEWDDGERCFVDPNSLEITPKRSRG